MRLLALLLLCAACGPPDYIVDCVRLPSAPDAGSTVFVCPVPQVQ